MTSIATVYVVVQCDDEDQWPIAVYTRKDEAEQEAKRRETAQKPEAEMKLSETHYAFRVDEVEFHA